MHEDDVEPEREFDLQETVNQAMLGTEKCRKIGVGPDGKLLYRWLGGDRATCTFQHPPSDILLKGKGVSNESKPRTPSFKPHSSFKAQKAVAVESASTSAQQMEETNVFLKDIDE